MQTPFLHLCKSFTSSSPLPCCRNNNLRFGIHNSRQRDDNNGRKIFAQQSYRPNEGPGNKGKVTLKGNKENTWSVDNEIAESEKRKRKPKGRRRGKRLGAGGRKGRVLVSGTMLIETETLLQTQVPIFYFFFSTNPSVKVMIFNYKNRFFFF